MAADQIAYPEWTDYRDKSGLDPLGMQNSSINLYQRLLPGISNVTLRMRYYGLYAWLASMYARRSRSTDIRKWQQLIRRAEALYALAAVQGGDDAGVSGSRWARRKLATSSGRISFAEQLPRDAGRTYSRKKLARPDSISFKSVRVVRDWVLSWKGARSLFPTSNPRIVRSLP